MFLLSHGGVISVFNFLDKFQTCRNELKQTIEEIGRTFLYFLSPSKSVALLYTVLADNVPFDDEDEGEPFDFDSGDDIPEAPPAPPCLPSEDSSQANSVTGHPEGSYSILGPPAQFSNSAPTSEYAVVATSKPSSAGCETTETEETSVAEGTNDREEDLPPLPSPPPPVGYGIQADPRSTGL